MWYELWPTFRHWRATSLATDRAARYLADFPYLSQKAGSSSLTGSSASMPVPPPLSVARPRLALDNLTMVSNTGRVRELFWREQWSRI